MRGRITHDTARDRDARRDYWGVVLDSRDPRALARFYVGLLEWEIGSEADDWVTVRPPDGVAYLAFHLNPAHVPPVWPSTGDQPQDDVRVMLDPDGHPFCLYLG